MIHSHSRQYQCLGLMHFRSPMVKKTYSVTPFPATKTRLHLTPVAIYSCVCGGGGHPVIYLGTSLVVLYNSATLFSLLKKNAILCLAGVSVRRPVRRSGRLATVLHDNLAAPTTMIQLIQALRYCCFSRCDADYYSYWPVTWR